MTLVVVAGCALFCVSVFGAVLAARKPKPLIGAPDIERCALGCETEKTFALIAHIEGSQ